MTGLGLIFAELISGHASSGNSQPGRCRGGDAAGGFLRYSGRGATGGAKAAHPKRPFVGASRCKRQRHNLFHALKVPYDLLRNPDLL
jgi:hypothetical protein